MKRTAHLLILLASACGVSLERSDDPAGGGGGGASSTSEVASTAEGTGGSGGVEPSFRETCERLYGAILEVTTELGCPHEEDVRYTCDPLLYEACLPEKTLQFGCLADWTTIERCSCGSGSGGEGGDDGFQCAWPCEGLGAAVEEACPTPSEE